MLASLPVCSVIPVSFVVAHQTERCAERLLPLFSRGQGYAGAGEQASAGDAAASSDAEQPDSRTGTGEEEAAEAAL